MANYLGYHQITLYPCLPPVPPDFSPQKEITLRQASATPTEIYLYSGGLYIVGGPKEITLRPTTDPLEVLAGVYPSILDVDVTAAKYGPSGTEYQGTLLQPIPANVAEGIGYGAGGTEFVGTLVAGTGEGLDPGTPLIDPSTGRLFIFIKKPLIVGVN
jgi:hypothetical protein